MEFATLSSLRKVISASGQVSCRTTGLPCSRAQELASDFLLKNVMVSLTIWNIVNPDDVEEFPEISPSFKMWDSPSAYVLIRTLFEGYINMHHVLLDPESEKERRLRMDLWDRHALLERQKMGCSIGSRHDKLERERSQIKTYTKSIRESTFVQNLPEQERESLINMHKWTKLTTLDRADRAGIHRSQSEFIFKFLSNYAHCEAYSLMQIHSIQTDEQARQLMDVPIRFTEMLLSLTLRAFAAIQPLAKPIIQKDKVLEKTIDFWEELKAKDLKEIPGLA